MDQVSELVAAGLVEQVGAWLKVTDKGRDWRCIISGIDVDQEAEGSRREALGCGSVAPPVTPPTPRKSHRWSAVGLWMSVRTTGCELPQRPGIGPT